MFRGISNERFDRYFKDENDCLRYLPELKWEKGYECRKCGCRRWWSGRRWFDRRCQRCGYNESPTAGTLFVKEEFGETNFGPNADSPQSLARISLLYDVLNYTTIYGQIDGFETSERTLLQKHLSSVIPRQGLLVMDRGYSSLALLFQLQQEGIDYCIRMKNGWWKEVRKMLEKGQTDKIITFKLPANPSNKSLLKNYNTTDNKIKCRLIVVDVPGEDTFEILCTSITDPKRLPYECFSELYHYRWNIEEGYKFYKSRAGLEAFSGKTAIAVKQDFYAKIFAITTMAVMAFPIEEKIKKEQQDGGRKYPHKVNRTNALSMVKEISCKVFLGQKIIKAIEALDRVLISTTEIVRKGRENPRKKRPKVPPSMNYKQL